MSIRVEMADLPAEILERGAGFLLTSVMDSRPHVIHHHCEVAAANGQVQLRLRPGRTATQNVGQRPACTMLWPATDDFEHSLIVDGEARVETDPDGDDAFVIITVTGAILHRPAPTP